ncbi:MAG: aconitase/3-isopropylmalate dehydratase large subunit family protein [Thermodesulfobacteriota bacterium]|nr:aconitase/3-isopropylmalate dehydratase large subunit family protein [Thermodesulfobacteriota bacterium]
MEYEFRKMPAGDFITAKIDLHYNLERGLVEVHNKVLKAGLPDGLPKMADPDAIAIMLGDHEGCHAKPQDVADYKVSRELVKRYGIKKLYEVSTGIAHATVPEEGLARPGMLVCGKDSHTTTCGAVNALATPVSAVETAWIYLTGELWFRVPETIKFNCIGKLQDGVVAKDIFLYVIGKYTSSMAQYKSLEWKGPVIDVMGMDGRLTLACQSVELGAKCAPFEPDSTCLEYVTSTPLSNEPFWPTHADPDAVYDEFYEEDFSSLEPQVALPHGFDVIKPISEVEGTKIDQCNLGSCANSRYDDLAIAARIVKGKKVRARMIFAPGSWKIYRKALKTGILETLIDPGVMVMAPTCLPCDGRGACIANGEVAVGTTTRNFRGRYGSPNSEIYLASPATAAASAIMGRITDPRKLL